MSKLDTFIPAIHDLDIPCSRDILIGSRTLHDVFP
nr:MAG TPA: hypothetical protein [Caudoviricetes sp.]